MTSENTPPDRRWYRFEEYVLDAPKRLLWRDRTLVPITSKTFEILLLLIQRRGRVVEKQELMDAIWPTTAVEENTLTRHISTLRKVLEERPEHHEFILTVPGHGYQFVAEVVELDARPEHLLHTLRVEHAFDGAPSPAATDSGGMAAFEATALEPIELAPDAVAARTAEIGFDLPAGAPLVPTRTSRATSGVALVAVVSLAAVTTALVFAALRADSPGTSMPPRNLRQVTFLGGVQKDPSWSPDGRHVAYASEHAGNSDLFVQALGESTPRQVTFSPAEDSQPDWSPDGSSIVFRSEADGGGIFVMSASGGTPRKIAAFGYRPRWSPAGALILFSSSGHLGGNPKFYLVGIDGRPPAPLRPDIFAKLQRVYVAWRPDGQTVSAWGRDAGGRRSFITTPIRTGPAIGSAIDPAVERRREEAGVTLDRFVWSRSGRHLLFEGRAQGTGSLWRVTVDPVTLTWNGGPDRLTTGTTQDSDAVLSPDGRRVMFSARSARTRLWMFPFDAAGGKLLGPGQPVTSGGAGEQDADAPDDGTKLVYRTLRGTKQQVWERTIADGRDRLLVEADDWMRTRPRWSPDGRWVAYLKRRPTPAGASGQAAVTILSIDRRQEVLVTRPGTPHLVPTDWSPDGKWLLGSCPQTGSITGAICVIAIQPDLNDGTSPAATTRVLTSDATHNLFEHRFSPDQRWISFIAVNAEDAGVSTIYIMPASGGPWQPVTDGSTYDDKPHWSPDGGTLYFVSHRDGVLNVWGRRIDSATGRPGGSIFQVTSFNSPRQMISTQLSQMQIALTGNRLFLPITDTQSELWMLENVDR